ncbi:MAG: methyl-accepting chemotaxis protein [Acidimicrobiales bacterium]
MFVRRLLGSRVSRQLTSIVGTVSVIGLAIMIVTVSKLATDQANDSAARYEEQVAEQAAAQVQDTLDAARLTAEGVAATLGTLAESGVTDRDVFNALLRSELESHPQFLGVYTGWEPNALDGRDEDFVNTPGHDATGRFVPYWNRGGGDVGLEPLLDYDTPGVGDWYLKPVQTGETQIFDPFVYPVGGEDVLMTSITTPVRIDGRIVGMAGVDIALDTLQAQVVALHPMETGEVALVSQGGLLVASHDGVGLGGPAVDSVPGLSPAVADVTTSTTWTGTVHEDEPIMRSISMPVTFGDTGVTWSVIVSVPVSTIEAPADDVMQRLLITGVIVALLVVLGCWLSVRGMLGRPVRRIAGAVERIAGGDLSTDVGDTQRADELGGLARAIEQYRTTLVDAARARTEEQRLLAEAEAMRAEQAALTEERARLLAEQVETRERAERERLESLHVLAERFSTEIGGITSVVSEEALRLRNRAEELRRTTSSTSEDAARAASMTEQAAQDIQHVATAVEQLTSSIHGIRDEMSRSKATADRAVDEAHQMRTQFQALAATTRGISDVVALIEQIASQTNLLALNATIEAARAGDAGKGFAVVASEVRDLAGQTAAATGDIARQIAEVQDATQRALEAMTTIDGTISAISDTSSTVAAAIGQQAAATQQIATGVGSAANGMDRVVRTVVDVARATTEAGAASDELAATTHVLVDRGQALEHESREFVGALVDA